MGDYTNCDSVAIDDQSQLTALTAQELAIREMLSKTSQNKSVAADVSSVSAILSG